MSATILISKELLNELLEYIKEMEEGLEQYRGDGRTLAELVQDGDAPEVYNKIIILKRLGDF